MLMSGSLWGMLILLCCNGFFLTALHGLLLYCCKRLRPQTLQPGRRRFRLQKWEQGGRFYRNVLKIHRWKDKVPQHIGRDGFSKANLEQTLTAEYLQLFFVETCRGEWYHTAALSGIPVLLLCNPLWLGAGIALPMALIHGGCIAIQRYNRGRLLSVWHKKYRGSVKDHGKRFSCDYSERDRTR